MKIIKKVNYEEVVSAFKEEHHIKHGTNDWALNTVIPKANSQFNGMWSYVELGPEEISKIFLPWHEFDCERGHPLIPKNTKMNVDGAVDKIESNRNYASRNPVCWGKIDYCSRQKNILPVFLSIKPILGIEEYDAYRNLSDQLVTLFHLDGLHRLISRGLKKDTGMVYAYIAGLR